MRLVIIREWLNFVVSSYSNNKKQQLTLLRKKCDHNALHKAAVKIYNEVKKLKKRKLSVKLLAQLKKQSVIQYI